MAHKKLEKWKILSSKLIINNRWVRIRQDKVRLPDSSIIDDFFVREIPDIVKVFALTTEKKVILVHQYKHGAGTVVTELPAGMVDPGEDHKKAMIRELREETGYAPKTIKKIDQVFANPTGENTVVHCFFATDCAKVAKPKVDPREIIEVELVTIPQLKRYVKQGIINGQGALAGVLLGLSEIGEI